MEIQLMMPSPALDFNFESTNTSPYTTAPSSPQRIPNFFHSAPTSPTRPFHALPLLKPSAADTPHSAIPFHTPAFEEAQEDDTDFAFDFSGQLEPPSISAADELFDCGKIKPLKPSPCIQVSDDPPKLPTSRIREAFSPRCKKTDKNPLTEALKRTPRDQTVTIQDTSQRGRERTTTNTRDKASRSLSPFRVSDIFSNEENNQRNSTSQSSTLTWYNKWNLKNLLLFRSASEGSATRNKDPLKKYSMIRKGDQDVKNSSFRSTDSSGSVGESRRRVSAHEIHYTANRAVAEEMKRKTFLPYKSGLLGCLGFHNNGGSVHGISRGISSVMRQGE